VEYIGTWLGVFGKLTQVVLAASARQSCESLVMKNDSIMRSIYEHNFKSKVPAWGSVRDIKGRDVLGSSPDLLVCKRTTPEKDPVNWYRLISI